MGAKDPSSLAKLAVLVLRAVCDFQKVAVGGRGPRHLPRRSLGTARGRKCSSRGGRRPRDKVNEHRMVGDGEGSRFKEVPPTPIQQKTNVINTELYMKSVSYFL